MTLRRTHSLNLGSMHLIHALRITRRSGAAKGEELPVRHRRYTDGGVVPAHVTSPRLLEARPRESLRIKGPAVSKGLGAVPAALDDHGVTAGLHASKNEATQTTTTKTRRSAVYFTCAI